MLYDPPPLPRIEGNTLVLGADDGTGALRTLARQAQRQGAAVAAITTSRTRPDWDLPGLAPLPVASTPQETAELLRSWATPLDGPTANRQTVLIVSEVESVPAAHRAVIRFLTQKRRLHHVVVGAQRWPLPGVLADHQHEFHARLVAGQNLSVLRDVVGPDGALPASWSGWSVQARPKGPVATIPTPTVVYPRTHETT